MVSKEIQKDIWQGLLDSACSTLYHAVLAKRYRRWDRALKYLTLASATGYFSAWLDIIPSFLQSPIQLVANGCIALFVLWGLIAEHARKEALLYTVSVQCKKIEDKWGALWVDVKRGALYRDADVASHRDKLKQAGKDWTQLPGYAGISDNPHLNEDCEAEALRAIKKRYNT